MACCTMLPSGFTASGKPGYQQLRTLYTHPEWGLERKSGYRDFKWFPPLNHLTSALPVTTKSGIQSFCPRLAPEHIVSLWICPSLRKAQPDLPEAASCSTRLEDLLERFARVR